jgi:hypothetical protein
MLAIVECVGYVEKEGVMLRNLTTLNETNVLVYGWSKGVLWQKKKKWIGWSILLMVITAAAAVTT